MNYIRLLTLAGLIALTAACAAPAVRPTPTPEPPTAGAPTPGPDDPVSATPLPPGLEGPPAATPPYSPAPGDEALQRGEVFIDSTQMIVAESFPPQFFVLISGSLPTPCHQLRLVAAAPDANNRIVIAAYSLADPAAVCVQMVQPFEVSLPLGSLPDGKYEVWVNDQPIGEISTP